MPATLWRPGDDRRRYVRRLIRAAAHVIASDDPNMRIATSVRVSKLDAAGNPTGETVDLGPTAFSMSLKVSLPDDPWEG